LQDSTAVIRQLNQNLASATGLLSNDPDEVGNAVRDINAVVEEVRSFVADNRETMGVASDRMASISGALVDSLDDLEQSLHVAPNTVQNFANIYHPAQGSIHSAMVMNMFADPITFVCGGVQAASRLNAEQSAKLCVQYLAPIVKNRQINFPPLGVNPFVGAMARPNELTYSEDWLRPDYVPPQPVTGAPAADTHQAPDQIPLAAEAASGPPTAPDQPDQANGLQDMMLPPGHGS
jgi:phospholipid/cholesterol/gamma-HCH transport system substrate-binding protein